MLIDPLGTGIWAIEAERAAVPALVEPVAVIEPINTEAVDPPEPVVADAAAVPGAEAVPDDAGAAGIDSPAACATSWPVPPHPPSPSARTAPRAPTPIRRICAPLCCPKYLTG